MSPLGTILISQTAEPDNPLRVAYGYEHPCQFGDLRLPLYRQARQVAILLHGGFWRAAHTLDLMTPLAQSLTERGMATLNLEYRRMGEGGTWWYTLRDVACGIDALANLRAQVALPPGPPVLIGHSAGGHLALWAAARAGLPSSAPGGAPRVMPRLSVSLAGICDLAEASHADLGEGAVTAFLGGRPTDFPERYAIASPAERLPLGVRQILIHGLADDRVPPAQSLDYARRARALGDRVTLWEVPHAGHKDLIDPGHALWVHLLHELDW